MERFCSKGRRRKRRHSRVRKTIFGTMVRPRLCVYKSLKHIYAQIINDEEGKTLVGCSTLSPEIREKISHMSNILAAEKVGELIGKKAKEIGVERVTFDRGGYIYHGVVKVLAEAARKSGLKF